MHRPHSYEWLKCFVGKRKKTTEKTRGRAPTDHRQTSDQPGEKDPGNALTSTSDSVVNNPKIITNSENIKHTPDVISELEIRIAVELSLIYKKSFL